MLEQLKAFDVRVLYQLNVAWGRPELDQFWLVVTQMFHQPLVTYGLVPAILAWLFYIYSVEALKPILTAAAAVGLSDAFCYRVVKAYVQRPRPFENPEITSWLRKVGDAHGTSFPSNHACNCFAAASVLSWYFPKYSYYFYTLALLVAISRPALGVHYPSDVLGGAILGMSIALIIRVGILNQFVWFRLPILVSPEDPDSIDWRLRVGRKLKD